MSSSPRGDGWPVKLKSAKFLFKLFVALNNTLGIITPRVKLGTYRSNCDICAAVRGKADAVNLTHDSRITSDIVISACWGAVPCWPSGTAGLPKGTAAVNGAMNEQRACVLSEFLSPIAAANKGHVKCTDDEIAVAAERVSTVDGL